MKRIYLDHNATTPLDPRVFKAMRPYMTGAFGNASSPHSYGRLARRTLDESREIIANAIGCRPEEIVFTSGGTEADNLALRGIAYGTGKRKGHVITSSIEHHAVLRTCAALEKEGFSATYLPVDSQGIVDPHEVNKSIREDTILISVMFANNETGVIQPVAELGRIAREHGIPFHCDAVQAVGKQEINVEELSVDLLTLSSHKIYGPQGTGALYVRDGIGLAPMITGGHHERGLRAGTENIAAIVGFARAVKIAIDEIDTYRNMVKSLRNKLEQGLLHALDGVAIHGAQGARLPHTSCIGFASVEAESILLHLDLKGIAASSGSACTTGDPEPSHVLTAMGVPPELAQGSIRISFGRENTEEEVNYTVSALGDAVQHLRGISSQWTGARSL
jgi:cysteine desulfurase